jgi:hypothetical protein
MIGGYDCTSCKSGGAKKKAPVKRRRGGNSFGEVSDLFKSVAENIKIGGRTKRRKVRKGGNTEEEVQGQEEMEGGAKKKRVRKVRKGGDQGEEVQGQEEMEGGAKKKRVRKGGDPGEAGSATGGAKKRKVGRVGKGGSGTEEFQTELAGGAKRKRKVGRVRRGGSETEEFQTELAGGAKKRKGAKKSLNPYIKFVKKHFQSMKKKNPNDTAPQIMKKIAVEYKKQK